MTTDSKNILLLGVGPVPPQRSAKTYAPGWYTWTLASTIRRAGHRVHLGLGIFGGGDSDGRLALAVANLGDGITAFELPLDPSQAAPVLQKECDAFKPAAAVIYTDVMANVACRVTTTAPRYFIFYGHPMAERQMQAAVGASDIALIEMWKMILPALLGGDRFGATSRDQQSALLGELGALGRMNRHNVNDPPVDQLPVPVLNIKQSGTPAHVKGSLIPKDAFMVMWLGGYNTWSDEETLFRALELAMVRKPRLHYVSCGGGIKGHVEQTYDKFVGRIAASPHKDRYHLVGWRPWDELGDFFADADAAVCTDLPTLEGRFGARTRILDLLLNEVPVVTNATDEATREFAELDMLHHVAPRDAAALADGLLAIAKNPTEHKRRAAVISAQLQTNWTPEKRWAPLLEWLEAPHPAPDLSLELGQILDAGGLASPYRLRIADNELSVAQAMFMSVITSGSLASWPARLKTTLKKLLR